MLAFTTEADMQPIIVGLAVAYAAIAVALVAASKRPLLTRFIVALLWLPIIVASMALGAVQAAKRGGGNGPAV